MSESRDILKEEFQDEEYRHAYAEDFLNTKIATQIRVLREQRGWTQADLADKIGTKQAGVSRLENVNYSGWKIDTLKRIARAFDVAFNAGFEAFGKLLDEAEQFSRQALEKPSFEDDPGFHEEVAASNKPQTIINVTVSETVHARDETFAEIPDALRKKALGFDKSSPIDPRVEIAKFLGNSARKSSKVNPSPRNDTLIPPHEERPHASLGGLAS